MKKLSMIAAICFGNVIGVDGGLPWPAIPEDWKLFKSLTFGKAVIAGRKTYESLPKTLPGRKVVVLSRTMQGAASEESIVIARNPTLAIAEAFSEHDEAFVIGGEQVYEILAPACDEFHLTHIHRWCSAEDPSTIARFPYDEVRRLGWDVVEHRKLAEPDVFYTKYLRSRKTRRVIESKSPDMVV